MYCLIFCLFILVVKKNWRSNLIVDGVDDDDDDGFGYLKKMNIYVTVFCFLN